MLDLDSLAKLQSLHTNGVPESLHLEYKASQAIQNSDARNEVSKDISAMANADGGQLIYGMTENRTIIYQMGSMEASTPSLTMGSGSNRSFNKM